jgi:hypothetical protein
MKKKENKLKVSVMSGKLKGIPSINTSPLNNEFCKMMSKNKKNICSKCYAIRSLKGVRKNCLPVFKNNGKIISKLMPIESLPKFKEKIVRFSSFGDLMNEMHLMNYLNMAIENPDTIFGLWSKRADFIKKFSRKMPENVIKIYSTPQFDVLNPKTPTGYDKVFSNYSKKFAEENNIKINCGKKDGCLDCQLCYNKGNGIQYINELIK